MNDRPGLWERIARVPAGTLRGQLLFTAYLLGVATVINVVLAVLMRSLIPVAAAGIGWVFLVVYALVRGVVDAGAGKAGKVFIPSGGTTPAVNQHSNIQAMVARGAYAQAAEAYRTAIEADPAEVLACEQLGQLALRELKDYELALWAYREGEKRVVEPRRKLGYATLAVGIVRDNLRDDGRTVVEMRKLLDRYPDNPHADSLRREMETLKARLFENR